MLIFLRKKVINKIKCSRSPPDPDFLGVTISGHVIYFRFLPFSKHLRTTEENQNWLIGSRTTSCNWGENFRLSHKERLLEPISKSPYIVNYLWDGVSNYVCSIILVIAKIYIYSSLFHFSFVIEAKPTFLDCVSSNIYSFYHCLSYTKHSDLWIRFVAYIWFNIVFLMRCANLFDFWFGKCQRQV